MGSLIRGWLDGLNKDAISYSELESNERLSKGLKKITYAFSILRQLRFDCCIDYDPRPIQYVLNYNREPLSVITNSIGGLRFFKLFFKDSTSALLSDLDLVFAEL